jgi:hypothetical protein
LYFIIEKCIIEAIGGVKMSDVAIERILKNTKFTMEMEGFAIDQEQEDIGRRILNGELRLADYIESVKQEARRFTVDL